MASLKQVKQIFLLMVVRSDFDHKLKGRLIRTKKSFVTSMITYLITECTTYKNLTTFTKY